MKMKLLALIQNISNTANRVDWQIMGTMGLFALACIATRIILGERDDKKNKSKQ